MRGHPQGDEGKAGKGGGGGGDSRGAEVRVGGGKVAGGGGRKGTLERGEVQI